jgi:hypothetical protein
VAVTVPDATQSVEVLVTVRDGPRKHSQAEDKSESSKEGTHVGVGMGTVNVGKEIVGRVMVGSIAFLTILPAAAVALAGLATLPKVVPE